jgi:hypothetical protein
VTYPCRCIYLLHASHRISKNTWSYAGDWDRAAALHGVAQAFRDRTGNPWHVNEARDRRDSLDQVRAHLGDEQLERAYAQGMALSLDKALDWPSQGRARPDRYRRETRGSP